MNFHKHKKLGGRTSSNLDHDVRGHVRVQEGSVVTIEGPERRARLETDDEVNAAVPSPDGTTVALASGEPVVVGAGGVIGNVSVVNADTGAVLTRSDFEDAVITGLTHSPRAHQIAFVKDYSNCGCSTSTPIA